MSVENLTIDAMNAMSPEDFAKLNEADILALGNVDDTPDDDQGTEGDEAPNEDEGQDDEGNDNPDEDDEGDDPDNQEDEGEQENDNSDNEEGEEQPLEKEAPKTDKPAEKQPKAKADPKPKVEVDPAKVIDATSFQEKVSGKFKANGVDYQITDPDEVVALMQKGLNYNLKMNQIKPYMGVGRLLEDNGLLNEPEKLGFLIDLHNKNPEAIAKLVKDSGIEAYELDEEKASAYKPTPANITPDNVVQLQQLVQTNKDNADFSAVYTDANGWDEKSQQAIVGNPEILETLTRHKTNGIYDKIMQQVNHEINVRGNKTPVMELYLAIGNSTAGNNNPAQAQNHKPAPVASAKVTKKVDPLLAAKRKIAGGTKSTSKATPVALTEEDIFNMSPEDFAKLDGNKLTKQS